MQIQSLSVCVPGGCLNNCKFCVANMNKNSHIYPNHMFLKPNFYDLYYNDYVKRLEFAKDNGCNTIVITGDGEPIINMRFLETFGAMNKSLKVPFRWLEIQTSGTTLDEVKLRFLRNHLGISTISLSLSSLDSVLNAEYNETPIGHTVDIPNICSLIKKYDFNLRLSLNMTDAFNLYEAEQIFQIAKEYGANQITIRELYTSKDDTPEDLWIQEHKISNENLLSIKKYILQNGKVLGILPFGAKKYSIHGMSVVIDSDCMNEEIKESFKYLILRPDCKLYSLWDDPASLIF